MAPLLTYQSSRIDLCVNIFNLLRGNILAYYSLHTRSQPDVASLYSTQSIIISHIQIEAAECVSELHVSIFPKNMSRFNCFIFIC